MKKSKSYYVYSILYRNTVIYIGLTNNIKRREYEHNRSYNLGEEKQLYNFLRDRNYTDKIELVVLNTFDTQVEGKRYECFLILTDYFSKKQLKQTVPSIRNR